MKKIIYSLLIFTSCIAQAQNKNVALRSQLTYAAPTNDLSNIGGYTDSTGKEYALVGWEKGLEIVDVSNPILPIRDTNIVGPTSIWREVKTYNRHAYVTTEGGGGLRIIDLKKLPNWHLIRSKAFTPTINVPGNTIATLNSIHALHIDTTLGNLYLFGTNVAGGIALVFSLLDPWNPTYLGALNNGIYVHDGYVDNDTLYACHISNGFFTIDNMVNKTSPIIYSQTNTPNNFTHNSWPTNASKNFILTTDEVNDSYLACYDVSNPVSPIEVDRIQSQNPGGLAIVHNTHVRNGYAITSWYKDGIVITDVNRPNNLVNIGWYDTSPLTGGGFDGAWGVYPFLPSGNLVVSDISQGLFVLTPNYKRACYIEGVVRDSTCGGFLSNANINVTNGTTTFSGITDLNGEFNIGTEDSSGTYTITISKSGFTTKTFASIILQRGIVYPVSTALLGSSSFSFNNQVNDSITTLAISSAKILVIDSNDINTTPTASGLGNVDVLSWNNPIVVNTNATGIGTIPCLTFGVYDVFVGKWGYKTKCYKNSILNNLTGIVNTQLPKNIYDDFTFDFGWTVTSTASTGAWIRTIPTGALATLGFINVFSNPNSDVNNDCGSQCFVTGNGSTAAGADDVDAGATTLTSPIFDLTTYINPSLHFSRWFFNGGGSAIPNDSLIVKLSNGITEVVLEKVHSNNMSAGNWVNKSYTNLSTLIAISNSMQLKVEVADYAPGHLVDAGFDDFYINEDAITTISKQTFDNQITISPNPFNTHCSIESNNEMSLINIYDVTGRIVLNMDVNDKKAIIVLDNKHAPGFYFAEIMFKDQTKKIVKINKI